MVQILIITLTAFIGIMTVREIIGLINDIKK
jgi:hypothetical protein